MGKPYSLDLRDRTVAGVRAGLSCREAAKKFSVSVASVVRWAQREQQTGSAGALPMGGARGFSLDNQRAWVLARVKEKPDITLRALHAELAERNVDVSLCAVWNFLKHEGITFKKKSARQRAGSSGRGAQARALAEVSGKGRSISPCIY
jgi:transposase